MHLCVALCFCVSLLMIYAVRRSPAMPRGILGSKKAHLSTQQELKDNKNRPPMADKHIMLSFYKGFETDNLLI